MLSIVVAVALAAAGALQGAPARQTDAARAGLRGAVRVVTTEVVRDDGATRETVSRETYDASGALVESVEYLRGEPVATTTYSPGPDGLVRERVVRPGGPRRTRLRPRVPRGPEVVTDSEGAELYVWSRAFDAAGRLLAETRYAGTSAEGATPLLKVQYRYDRDGRIAEARYSEGAPLRLARRVVFGYAGDGPAAESVRYGANFQDPQKSTYEYVLDDAGNWVERRESRLVEGVPVPELRRRAITYHGR